MNATVIVIAPDADELQRFAAAELRRYLQRLFGVSAVVRSRKPDGSHTCFLLGPVSASHIRQAGPSLPNLSSQGHLLRRVDEHTMIGSITRFL